MPNPADLKGKLRVQIKHYPTINWNILDYEQHDNRYIEFQLNTIQRLTETLNRILLQIQQPLSSN